MDRTLGWSLHDAVVGSHVLVRWTGYNRSPGNILTVTKAAKSKVTLSDGSEWRRGGGRWGQSRGSWTRETAHLILDLDAVRAEIAEGVALANLARGRNVLRRRVDDEAKHLSAEQIAAIIAILDSKPDGSDAARDGCGSEPLASA